MLTYVQAQTMWEGRRNKKKPVKLQPNTFLDRVAGSEDFVVRLYETDIVRLIAPSVATEWRPLYQIDTGGHCTKTTIDRVNDYAPAHLRMIKGECFAMGQYEAKGQYQWLTYAFARGMVCDELGRRVDEPAEFVDERTGKPL